VASAGDRGRYEKADVAGGTLRLICNGPTGLPIAEPEGRTLADSTLPGVCGSISVS